MISQVPCAFILVITLAPISRAFSIFSLFQFQAWVLGQRVHGSSNEGVRLCVFRGQGLTRCARHWDSSAGVQSKSRNGNLLYVLSMLLTRESGDLIEVPALLRSAV